MSRPSTEPAADARRCELCGRAMAKLTLHHLVPREKGGKYGPKVALCSGCHHQIHSLFTNAELAADYSTLDALRTEPRMARYLRWARRQKPGKTIRVRRGRRRR